MRSIGQRGGLLLGLALLALAVAVVALRFELTTSIGHFLPAGADTRLVQISHAVADSELTRTVVLTLGGPDEATVVEASADLTQRLDQSDQVDWVRRGVSQAAKAAVQELYFPRRLMLLSDRPDEELPHRLSDQGLRQAAAELKRQLTLPTAPLVRSLAPADPLGAFGDQLERLEQANAGSLELRHGQLITEGGRGVILLGSRPSAFDTAGQKALQADIEAAFAVVDQAHGGELDLDQSGFGRFAITAEREIKADITRISIASTLGVILLYLLLFRSPRALGLVLLPLASGVAGAAALTLLIFGQIHGITLAFGATLIGVAIDYAVHLQSHQALAPHPDGPRATLKRIWAALVLGALTTVAGLGGLGWTDLPGLREIALFAGAGVLLALGATRLLLPPLLPTSGEPPRPLARLAAALERLIERMSARRGPLFALPLAAVGLMAFGLPSVRWVDDVTAFQPSDPTLRAEEERVRAQMGRMDSSRMVVALGADEQQALERNDEVYQRLRQARDDGTLGSFRSIHPLLWSASLQRRNLEHLEAAPDLGARTLAALESQGFRPEPFAPFVEALEQRDEGPAPLELDDLRRSPLVDMVRPFRVEVGDQVAMLTFLREVEDPAALERRLEGLDGVVYFDQHRFISEVYRHSRERTVQLMLVGVVAVLLLVLLRYRRPRLALAATAPAFLAAGATLAATSLAGMPATLFQLLGLLLVLSIGVDYGVFMVESREHRGELAATAVGVVVACLSTVLAFGLLALSSNPALRAMGLTTGVGVLSSLVLAPTALVLLGGEKR